jgi:hypothetical protein
MFRLSLDSLGLAYKNARLVLCVGSPHPPVALPKRWEKAFQSIELHWVAAANYAKVGDGAQGHELYNLVSSSADISIICDADSMLLAPLPDQFCQEMTAEPAICGVIAHFAPPLSHYPESDNLPVPSQEYLWDRLARATLGLSLRCETPYTLATDGSVGPGFYINHAFIAAPPQMLRELHRAQEKIRPIVRQILDNDFYDQIAVALAVEKTGLPYRQLPMRFNFPNDRQADSLYPCELENVVLLHYLRTQFFDRHCIFTSEACFEHFLSLELVGSDARFQQHVRSITGGVYSL